MTSPTMTSPTMTTLKDKIEDKAARASETGDAARREAAFIKGAADLNEHLGARVREARRKQFISRRQLAEKSNVSMRYLAQLESGTGNVSIGLLFRIAAALECRMEWLIGGGDADLVAGDIAARFDAASLAQRRAILEILGDRNDAFFARANRIALVGVRGGGKSTLGRKLSDDLEIPFHEVSDTIEEASGIPIGEVIGLYGEDAFRSYEADAVASLAAGHDRVLIAVGGGIVDTEGNYDFLLRNFHTIWVKTSPSEHISRVRAQGDERPMAGFTEAEAHLESMLHQREAEFARASFTLDTSGKSEAESLDDLAAILNANALL